MNSVFFDDATIDRWIAEDAPLLDLTTHILAIGNQPAQMQWVIRHAATVACSEEAARIATRCGAQVLSIIPSGQQVHANTAILCVNGPTESLLRAWKVAQNLLEHACGIATATQTLVHAVHSVASKVAVLTTRKHPPGVKAIALKSTLSGGAFPHRLGVGETILIFNQHRALLGDWNAVHERLQAIGHALTEKKIVIEAETLEQAQAAIATGAHVVQFDKVTPTQLQAWCPQLKSQAPHIHLLAAGGIRLENAKAYATSGVDALVTSSLHYAPPADIGVKVERLPQ
ncbi:ModD protein [Lampropedia puyangensis]|uniref:Putative pyrophosphorylase ModD n=1 Tax=Lampropedia puyangensis TaxID=1330072 RepID=A0A4S8F4S0_9BURK|nr:ModD protein [Lampropedia puyangensis]THU02019.1 ModD protein [Lampropedia puyangensis]